MTEQFYQSLAVWKAFIGRRTTWSSGMHNDCRPLRCGVQSSDAVTQKRPRIKRIMSISACGNALVLVTGDGHHERAIHLTLFYNRIGSRSTPTVPLLQRPVEHVTPPEAEPEPKLSPRPMFGKGRALPWFSKTSPSSGGFPFQPEIAGSAARL